ncbi:hypothetical protein B0G81_8255 [Paraburkholderia sp. BL6665CI2N2]|nr:hypothetical protein B0G81_8255 [Paraburkholderia sp. BL6665CI2N2]
MPVAIRGCCQRIARRRLARGDRAYMRKQAWSPRWCRQPLRAITFRRVPSDRDCPSPIRGCPRADVPALLFPWVLPASNTTRPGTARGKSPHLITGVIANRQWHERRAAGRNPHSARWAANHPGVPRVQRPRAVGSTGCAGTDRLQATGGRCVHATGCSARAARRPRRSPAAARHRSAS